MAESTFRWSQLDLSACPAASLLLRGSSVLYPLIRKCHWCPAIATSLLVQATQARKHHVRPGDHNILARQLRQQLAPRGRRRSRIDVEYHRDLGVLQLDALCMDGVA